MTRSTWASWFRAPAAMPMGLAATPVARSCDGSQVPPPPFKKIVTVERSAFATARSGGPSPLKSAATEAYGGEPVVVAADWTDPLLFVDSMEAVPDPLLTVLHQSIGSFPTSLQDGTRPLAYLH